MNHDMQRRFAYIETCLYWRDGLTASQLARVFGIARQNAHNAIANYRKHHPDNIYYDSSLRCHRATHNFTPLTIETNPESYLDYISGIASIERYWMVEEWTEIPFESDDHYLKPPQSSEIVKQVLSSIQKEQCLDVLYRSKDEVLSMTISAHHLVFANYRYHVRAFNHDNNWYSDLVLTRFMEASPAKTQWVSDYGDKAWNNKLELTFIINPELPKNAQLVLKTDYRLEKNIRIITVRRAMLGYIRREMERIDWKYKVCLWLEVE